MAGWIRYTWCWLYAWSLSLTINGYYYIFIKSFEQDISDIAAEEVVESDAGFTADSDKKKPSVEIIDNKMMEKSIFYGQAR
jgi:hypothetical protein